MVTISYVLLRALVSQPLHHWPRQDVQSGRMMWRREIWSCSCHSLQFFFCLFPFCAISHARDKESFMKYYSTECRTVGTDNYKKCPFRDASSRLVEIIGLFISISAHSPEFPTFSQIIIISGRPFLNPFINLKLKRGRKGRVPLRFRAFLLWKDICHWHVGRLVADHFIPFPSPTSFRSLPDDNLNNCNYFEGVDDAFVDIYIRRIHSISLCFV